MTLAIQRLALLVGCVGFLVLAGCSDDAASPTEPDPIDTEQPDDPGDDPTDDPTPDPEDPGDPVDPDPDDPDDPEPEFPWPSSLLEQSELTTDLFGWPERDFGRGNAATIHIAKRAGDSAVDFTLKDVGGVEHRLASMLSEKPVLLILGSFT